MTAPAARIRRLRWLLCLLAGLALVLTAYLARDGLLPMVARFLDVSEPPTPVDAVMVLGGGTDTRPFVAAALVRSGKARRVLVPTVRHSHEGADRLSPSEGELIRRILRARGVSDDDIVTLPGEVDSTRDEAQALNRFLDSEPDTSVTVVTNGFHTRRAHMLFRHELGDRMARVHFVAAPTDRFNENNWWRHEEGFSCYATEYFKLVYYGLREDRLWQGTVIMIVGLVVGLGVVRWRRRRRVARENAKLRECIVTAVGAKESSARASDQHLTFAGTTRLRSHLDWDPRVGLDEGLSRPWEWIKGQ
jgi:uncharacterized SAM-binding protein YcdF (DUF218 family)